MRRGTVARSGRSYVWHSMSKTDVPLYRSNCLHMPGRVTARLRNIYIYICLSKISPKRIQDGANVRECPICKDHTSCRPKTKNPGGELGSLSVNNVLGHDFGDEWGLFVLRTYLRIAGKRQLQTTFKTRKKIRPSYPLNGTCKAGPRLPNFLSSTPVVIAS